MVQRNHNMAKLRSGYLFPEINRRKKEFLAKNPQAKIISLGIGNTTEPLTPHIVEGLRAEAVRLGTREGYSGYGDEQGLTELREKIARKIYGGLVQPSEVFVSDGAKCDIGRLQVMFGSHVSLAVQDPSYPVYVDGSVIIGATGVYDNDRQLFAKIVYMPCSPANDFFPELARLPRTDLIYFCSPNNPTGAVASRRQLQELVAFARHNKSVLLFDAAYSAYIHDPAYARSIFEIEGARDVAIEISSFSKTIGFTGVRLGWTVVPEQLAYDDGTPVRNDWNRIMTTIFNGASNIAQHGGLASLDEDGWREMQMLVAYYMENARLIKHTLQTLGIQSYGGTDSPYIWACFPGRKSWDVFNLLLEKCHLVTTPGCGFGPSGEGFLRFSSYGHREDVVEACRRLAKEKI